MVTTKWMKSGEKMKKIDKNPRPKLNHNAKQDKNLQAGNETARQGNPHLGIINVAMIHHLSERAEFQLWHMLPNIARRQAD